MTMKQELPALKIHMFGHISMTYGDKPILFYKNNVTKAVKLAAILFFQGEEGIERSRLIEELYGREEISDAANSLRVTAHRLKKALIEAGLPSHEYIAIKDGIYRWSSPMETIVDAVQFRELLDAADQQTAEDERANLLREAIALYKGEFLQEMSGEYWVLLEDVQYKKRYTKALSELCRYLEQQGEYEELLSICEPACELYPFDEWQAVKIDAYIALGRYDEALKEYEDAAKLFFEELGVNPSDTMLSRLKKLEDNMNRRHQTLSEIKEQLKEEKRESGAFYCSFHSFRDEYRMVRRIMERSGQSIYLVLCTITDEKGRPLEHHDPVKDTEKQLHDAIKDSLRRCDSFTRYSPGQYLILLVGTNGENCEVVCRRISRRFSQIYKSGSDYLGWHISSVADVENEPLGIPFAEKN